MAMQLTSAKDCHLFKFWWASAISAGIQYQGKMFLQFQVLPVERMSQAYETTSELDDAGADVILVKTPTEYLLGISLSDYAWLQKLPQLQVSAFKVTALGEGTIAIA